MYKCKRIGYWCESMDKLLMWITRSQRPHIVWRSRSLFLGSSKHGNKVENILISKASSPLYISHPALTKDRKSLPANTPTLHTIRKKKEKDQKPFFILSLLRYNLKLSNHGQYWWGLRPFPWLLLPKRRAW